MCRTGCDLGFSVICAGTKGKGGTQKGELLLKKWEDFYNISEEAERLRKFLQRKRVGLSLGIGNQ